MSGQTVFRWAVWQMAPVAQKALDAAGVTPADLAAFTPHQANVRIIDAALEDMAFPPERVVVNLDKYGNTSAASVPIALDEGVRTGRCGPGDTILLVAFGGGLTWSSALITL